MYFNTGHKFKSWFPSTRTAKLQRVDGLSTRARATAAWRFPQPRRTEPHTAQTINNRARPENFHVPWMKMWVPLIKSKNSFHCLNIKTVDSTVTQRFLTDWLTFTHFQHDFSMFSRWASKIAPRISLLIVAVEWRHGLQQASLRIDIVFNVCSLVEPACYRSREPINTSTSPSNLFSITITWLCRVEQVFDSW